MCAVLIHEFQDSKALRHMEGLPHGGLPGKELSRLSLTAKEVHPKPAAGVGWLRIDGSERNAHGSLPDFRFRIDAGCCFKARIPPRAVAMRLVQIDIEIEPFVLRRQLEFFVAANLLKI